jgi:hypothetical protein
MFYEEDDLPLLQIKVPRNSRVSPGADTLQKLSSEQKEPAIVVK